MVTYPIRTARNGYRGSDPKKRAKAAEFNQMSAEIERYLNDQLQRQTSPIQEYEYHRIASQTGYTEDQVLKCCFVIDCGHHGFTAFRSGMRLEEALNAAERGG